MVERQQHAPACIYVLADHLDTVLAATEDLLKLGTECPESCELFRLELVAITHVLQARQCIRELQFSDPALADQSTLFIERTAAFETGKATSQPVREQARLTENYLIGRLTPISLMAELASAMLDALETGYVLYHSEGDQTAMPASPAEIWSSAPAPA